MIILETSTFKKRVQQQVVWVNESVGEIKTSSDVRSSNLILFLNLVMLWTIRDIHPIVLGVISMVR